MHRSFLKEKRRQISKNDWTFVIYPKCFQQSSNPQKSVILFKVMVRLIWAPVSLTSGEMPDDTSESEVTKTLNF